MNKRATMSHLQVVLMQSSITSFVHLEWLDEKHIVGSPTTFVGHDLRNIGFKESVNTISF